MSEPVNIIEKEYIFWEGSNDGQMIEHTRIIGIIDEFIKDIPVEYILLDKLRKLISSTDGTDD